MSESSEKSTPSFISTNLANFVAKAYGMPSELLANIYENTDTIGQRNFLVFISCFVKYASSNDLLEGYTPSSLASMMEGEGRSVLSKLIDKNVDRFLANAVVISFQ